MNLALAEEKGGWRRIYFVIKATLISAKKTVFVFFS
jgi:hypothetical protein